VAIIDEIDNDLHPHLLPHLIDLFKFEHTNPHQAQLILVVIHLKSEYFKETSNLFGAERESGIGSMAFG
jgi:AAA15 family ATPase/GTPase